MVKVPPDPHKSQNNQYSVVALEKKQYEMFLYQVYTPRRMSIHFKILFFFGDQSFLEGGYICQNIKAVGGA